MARLSRRRIASLRGIGGLAALVVASVVLLACSADGTGTGAHDAATASSTHDADVRDAETLDASRVAKYPSFHPLPSHRSVLDAGHGTDPIIVSDPSVYADAEGYHAFFTTIFCRAAVKQPPTWLAATKGSCVDTPKGTIGYAYSSDRGNTWRLRDTPVIGPRADHWDSGDIETPFVVRVKDDLLLFYAAFGSIDARFGIGSASLPLGASSVRAALLEDRASFVARDAALVPPDFDNAGAVNNAQEPSVVVHDGSVDLYYVAIGLTRPDLGFVAGQAPTGIGLRRRTFDGTLAEVAGSDHEVLANVNIAEVYEHDGALQLFSTSLEDNDYHHGERILSRRSTDGGATWTDAVEALGFNHGDYDNWGVMAPSVVFEPTRAVLFFTAWEAVNESCAQAARLGTTDDAGHCLFATLGRAEAEL